MAGFFIAYPDEGQAFSKDPPFEGSERGPSAATVDSERNRPMIGIDLAIAAAIGCLFVIGCKGIADA